MVGFGDGSSAVLVVAGVVAVTVTVAVGDAMPSVSLVALPRAPPTIRPISAASGAHPNRFFFGGTIGLGGI